MRQKSVCFKCQIQVTTDKVFGDRAYFLCPKCNRKWSTRAYHGKEWEEDAGGHGIEGAIVGTILTGGNPFGGLIGSIIGSMFRKKRPMVRQCLCCGGVGRPTGSNGVITMFQCENCLRTWISR
jgi:hypothetical protein